MYRDLKSIGYCLVSVEWMEAVNFNLTTEDTIYKTSLSRVVGLNANCCVVQRNGASLGLTPQQRLIAERTKGK